MKVAIAAFRAEEVLKDSVGVLKQMYNLEKEDTVFLQNHYFDLVFPHEFLSSGVKGSEIILLEGVC